MRLLIATGLPGIEPGVITDEPHLVMLYRSPRLVIKATFEVQSVQLERGDRAFLVGHVIGVRSQDGGIRPLEVGCRDLAEVISTNSIERYADLIEGRYIIVLVRANDTCQICLDRFGQMDLFYQTDGQNSFFSTDLSLLPIAKSGNPYDQAALAHTLCVYGYRPPKRHTIYKNVHRLGVGELVHMRDGRVEISEIPFKPQAVGRYAERELNEYADSLLDAVRVRGSRYGNIVYLSSGWDSTTLLACLVTLFGSRKVRAVTGRMQYAERSGVINQFELDRAKAVADYYGVPLDIAEFDYRKQGPELVEELRPLFRSRQIGSLAALNHFTLAKFVARTQDGDETAFCGEISDGAHNLGFCQFVSIFHPVLEFREYSDKMASYLFGPTFLRLLESGEFVRDPIYTLFRSISTEAVFDEPATDTISRKRQLLASFFLRANRVPLWSLKNSRLLTEAGRNAYSEEMEKTYLDQAARELSPDNLYSWYLHLYNSFHWQGSTVATHALAADAARIKLALPFLDSRLQDFLSCMPESWGRGLDLNATKFPLKWMLKHRVDYPLHLQVGPHSYLYDVDPSFSHTAEVVYGSAFTPYFKDLLKRREYQAILAPQFFDLHYVDSMVDRYLAGTEVRGAEMNDLMAMCQLSMVGWYGCERLSH